jgi:hypothetical protein
LISIQVETEEEKECGNCKLERAKNFLEFHEKVSIQDAFSYFGPRSFGAYLYLFCLSRKLRFCLEPKSQGLLHRLGSEMRFSRFGEIS